MRKLKSLVLALSLVIITTTSCNVFKPVSVTPPFTASIVNDISTVGQKVEMLYTLMEQSTDKTFLLYQPQYNEIEVIVNSIEARNAVRPKSTASAKQITLYKNMFLKFKGEHQSKVRLNNSEIRVYKLYMTDQLKPLFVAEMSLK